MSEKEMRLEMSFPTANGLIDRFNSIFCSWGQIKTPKDSTGNIRGKIKVSIIIIIYKTKILSIISIIFYPIFEFYL